MRRFLVFVVPAFAYAGLIFFLSSRPSLPAPAVEGFDKFAHLVEYGGLGFLTTRAFGAFTFAQHRAVIMGVMVGVLFGASDEIHQMFTPQRTPELADLVADTVGSMLGAMAWLTVQRLRRPRGHCQRTP